MEIKEMNLEAFKFMKDWIRDSFRKATENEDIPLKRFAFDSEALKEPSEFEVFFKYKNNEYQYGILLDNKEIFQEWLYLKKENSKDRYITLFERSDGKIDCNSKLLKGAENFISMVEDKTLFLSIISNAKVPYAKDVFRWFILSFVMDYGNINFEGLVTQVPSPMIYDESYQKELVLFLNSIDINIEGLIVDKPKNENEKPEIYTKHLMKDKKNYYNLLLSEESSGTQKMFTLFFYLQTSLKLGVPLFIDELDAKLHPLL